MNKILLNKTVLQNGYFKNNSSSSKFLEKTSMPDEYLNERKIKESNLKIVNQVKKFKLPSNSSAYAIGVDIGGTKIFLVITDLDGKVIFQKKAPTTKNIEDLKIFIQSCIKTSGIQEELIIGMGIGVPSTVDTNEGIVLDAYALGWKNIPLSKLLSSRFRFPIWINNDVNFATLGENWLGAGKSMDMIFIAIGTGLGCGVIANGELVLGHEGKAGEIGLNIDSISDNRAQDGFGALEYEISGSGLKRKGDPTKLFQDYYEKNEPGYTEIKKFIEKLTLHIVNIVNLLNPEKIIIGGGVSESMENLIYEIQTIINNKTPLKTKVECAKLGNTAGAMGAIKFVLDKLK
ncbi:ROK family protein [Bacillaceae bacterium S4-13-58]